MLSYIKNDFLVNNYWNSIKNAPSEIKLRLIGLLSEALVKDELKMDMNLANDELLKQVTGSWDGPETTEEIINLIREKRTCRPPLSL